MTARRITALVLAGRRDSNDALAEAAGAPHRALLDVQGTPMLSRVLATLEHHPRVGRILLSMDAPELLDDIPAIAESIRVGRVRLIPAADSPSRSVLHALDETVSDDLLLVTTADHALLDAEMLDIFLAGAEQEEPDLAVALVPARILEARFPGAKRTYLPFRGERYSGANLFAFLTPRARVAVEFWQRAESFRKTPWRLVGNFGVGNLVLFLLRVLDLDAAFRRVSRRLGVEVRAVEMPMAEAAVDVDSLADLALVNEILKSRC